MKSKSNDTDRTGEGDNVLERNVTTLLEAGGDAPRLSDIARARIRARLVDQHGVVAGTRARTRSPLIAIGIGLAATAAAALIVTRVVGDDPRVVTPPGTLADGSTWLVEPGAKVDVIGPRHVRVTGAALLDVAPGKGTFVVETARGRIEVLGTRFLVQATADRTTTAVVRGQVKLATADGEVVLHAGEQGVAEPGRPPSRGPAPRLSHLVSWAAAARKRDEHAVKPLRNGTLYARDPNNPSVPESRLPISKLAVDVVVEDQVARVAIDQSFYNPSTMMMEGMYRFAIPPDASLQRLAMYVNGQLMESGVVERMQGRRIYEDIVYRRLDPALLEWAGTGRLALRVYPLPPREDKRLLLAYTQSLPKLYDDWTLSVPLPEVDLPVGELGFDVRVRGCANCEVTSPSHKITVQRTGEDAVVSYRAKGATLGDSLVLRVRDPRKQAIVATHAEGDDRFLLVRAHPELRTAARMYRPRTWVILDDVSASRGTLELRAQADLIDGFMRELDEDDRVAVVAFDVEARTVLAPTRVADVADVDRRALRTQLATEGGIGATSFAAALAAATKLLANVAPEDAMIVYLGDGVITTGTRNLDALRAELAGKAHFIGVGVGDGPDTQTLDALAAATGGYATTIDLADDVGWRAFDLIAALHTARVTGIEARLVDVSHAEVPATIYVKTPQLADGEELELVGKLAGGNPPVAVILRGTLHGQSWEQRVELASGSPTAGYLPRLWAQRHIAARLLAKHDAVSVPPCSGPAVVTTADPLRPTTRTRPVARAVVTCATEGELREQRDEAIRREVVALGKQYFVLSRHTSLLVLEDDAMYAKYGVTKGAGETWAPYKVPAKIPVVPWSASSSPVPGNVADDAELVRSPLRVFYDHGGNFEGDLGGAESGLGWTGERGRWRRELAGEAQATRGSLGLGPTSGTPVPRSPMAEPAGQAGAKSEAAQPDEEKHDSAFAKEQREDRDTSAPGLLGAITTDQLSGGDDFRATVTGSGFGRSGAVFASGKRRARWAGSGYFAQGGLIYPQRFTYPSDTAYDDLTAFVPALFHDASDRLRAELAAAGGKASHPIDDASRALLAAARAALPAGIYRWSDREIALDAARRLGWRFTTGADLGETASFDGTTWTRRYAELGLDVTRTIAEDDIALALANIPLWIAEPAHYARWFEVRAAGPREVALWRARASIAGGIAGKPELAYVLVFDDNHHLVAIRDGSGSALVEVTWGAAGPTAARVGGVELDVGFTAQPIADAAAWAHGDGKPGIVVELPGRLPAYWAARLATLAPGTPAWRHATRQHLVSLAATGDRSTLFAAYERLRTNGGVELGDLVLASSGLATASTDAQLGPALAPFAGQPLARYLAAARGYGKNPTPERIKAQVESGLVGALWTLREATALMVAGKHTAAVDRVVSLGGRAFDLRLIGAAATTQHYQMKPADVVRAWDAVATGDYKNVARAQAAIALGNRGAYDAAAERVAMLVADLDLRAAPPVLPNMQWQFQSSRRGQAGWQLVWATWRDRALASSSYDHVIALMSAAPQQPADIPAILARAAELAAGDPDRVVQIAQLATNHGHAAMAQALVEPLVKSHPTRELHQLVAGMALRQGRPADALAHLEAAQAAAGDEAVGLSTVRAELGQLVTTARQLAVQSSGAARQAAVQRALTWASKWRVIDPGNAQIDQQVGDLLLAVGQTAEAWRHLSSMIERDPMSAEGYQLVAQAFERQGRVADAVAYWHQATILDQTNPTHRLREAQALIAVGRTAEGDALLADIAKRRWHVRWDGVVYQVKALVEQSKRAR